VRPMSQARQRWPIHLVIRLIVLLLVSDGSAWADTKENKALKAVITDTQGVETEVKNVLFYWEEKVSVCIQGLAQQLSEGMGRAVPVQDFPGPIVEHCLHPLDLAS